MSHPAAPLVFALGAMVSACASVPAPSGTLSSYDALGEETGYVAKRRVAVDPALLAAFDDIFLEPVQFDVAGAALTPEEEQHISAVLNRSLCRQAARRFRIVSGPGADRLSVRVTITGLARTSRSAAIASSVLPVRPPLGLGALTVEGEAMTPSGDQASAMVWARKADPLFTSARASSVGDAYNFAGQFGDLFGKMLRKETPSEVDARKARVAGLPEQEEPCAAFGDERLATSLLSIFSPVEPPPGWEEE